MNGTEQTRRPTPEERILAKPLRKLAGEREFLMGVFDMLELARTPDELHPFPDFVERDYGVLGFPVTRMVALNSGCETNICRDQIVLRTEGDEHPEVLIKLQWEDPIALKRVPLDYASVWRIRGRRYARGFASGVEQIIKNMHKLWEAL